MTSLHSDQRADRVDNSAVEARDREWLARIREADEPAFEAVFHAYSAGLYRFVYGCVGSAAIAEELVQDLFFKLWTERAGGLGEQPLRAYLYTVARSRSLDYLRHERVVAKVSGEVANAGVVLAMGRLVVPADERLRAEEANAALERVIKELPERARQAFTLYWRHELRYAEVAAVMGISVKTVENHLATALKILRRRLASFYQS